MRAPVVAIGWPRLQPLPNGLTRSGSSPSSWVVATATAAKASLTSNTSTSATSSPARSRALRIARIGARPVSTGSTPTLAQERIVARGVRPCSAASAASATRTAAAPSFTPLELPAVMEKPSISGWSAFRAASLAMLVSRRGCSSTSKTEADPSRPTTLTGMISPANRPSSTARTARSCERSAQASISSREMPSSRAVFQPTRIDMSS